MAAFQVNFSADGVSMTGATGPAGPPGTGNMDGPSSSTDNAVARFNGTTGKLLQNSGVTIDDSNLLSLTVSGSSVAGSPLSIIQSNAAFNHYTAYIESNQTTTLSNDTLRIVSNGGAVGSRSLFIKQNSDAAALIIDATSAPQTTIGANLTVFNIDGVNTAFSMAKFTNNGISTTNNSNIFAQNLQPTTTARVITAYQYGTAPVISVETNSTTNPAIEVANASLSTAVYGIKVTSTDYGILLKGGTGLHYDGDSLAQLAVDRSTGTSGARLELTAGGAKSGATDAAGGELRLSSGLATGNSSSDMTFRTYLGSGSGTSDATAREVMRIFGSGNANGRVAIGTSILRTGADGITLGGNSTRVVWMNRHTTADTAGNSLTVQAGGATSVATNKAAGNLVLQTGTSTGTGSASILLQTPTPSGSGTTDNDPVTRMTVDSTGTTFAEGQNIVLGTITGTKIGTVGGSSGQKIGFFNTTPIVQPLLATGAAATVDNVITVLQNLGLVRQS